MTVPSTTSAVSIVGTGTTAVLPYSWQIASSSDLVVYTWLTATGVITPLVLNTDYTVDGVGIQTGGNVTLVAGNLAVGTTAFIASDPAEIQALLLQQGAAFNPADLMNALDLLTREVQAARRVANNSLQFPVVESLLGLTTTLPAAAQRASKIAGFDASGNVIAYSPGSVVLVTPGSGTVTQPTLAPDVYYQVDTMAALRALGSASHNTVLMRGFGSAGDGGDGVFRWNAADATADNGGTVIQPNALPATGRWNRLGSDEVSVKCFGAVADGATDNATSLALAVASGKKLIFSGGGTFVSGQLTFNQAGQVIEFRNRTTLKAKTNTNATFLQFTAANVTMYGDGIIDGNKANQTLQTIAVGITGNDVRLTGLRVNNSHSYGIYGLDCSRSILERCKVVDSGNIGILFSTNAANMDQTSVIDCVVDRSTMTAATIVAGGIQIHGSVGSFASSNILVQGCKAFLPTNPTDAGCIGIELWGNCTIASVTGNLASGGAMGISFNNTSDASITANTCYNNKLYGIELADSSDTAVSSNSVDGNSLCTRGIILDGSVTFGQRIAITGNTVRRCTGYGIYTFGGARDITITGNSVNCPSGCSGIYLNSTQRFTVSGNLLRGAAAGSAYGIFMDTSWKGNISGNLVTNFDLNWLNIFASTAVTITDLSIVGNNSDAGAGFATSLSGGAALGQGFSIRGNVQAGFLGQGGHLAATASKSAAYTCTAADHTIKADATGGAFTVTLPTTVPYGTIFVIKRMNAGGNLVTIGGTVDGTVNPTLAAQYNFRMVSFNGTNYDIIGTG